jgi:hypothetical protein
MFVGSFLFLWAALLFCSVLQLMCIVIFTTVVCLGHSLETARSKEKNWFVVLFGVVLQFCAVFGYRKLE